MNITRSFIRGPDEQQIKKRGTEFVMKTALITGGMRGIGFGISQKLAAEGWDLAISGRRELTEVRDQVKELESNGVRVCYYRSDIAEDSDRTEMLKSIGEDMGRLDLLVNNAGVAPKKRLDILEADEESFDLLININLKGPYFLTRDTARWMIEQKRREPEKRFAIINIGSVSAEVASPTRGDYCISKAGVAMATKLWAARLGEYGIPVYEIQPGIVKTDMTGAVQAKYDKLIEEGLLLQKRWGLPDDIGKTVASLARGDLPYSTGQMIRVDGGLTLQRL